MMTAAPVLCLGLILWLCCSQSVSPKPSGHLDPQGAVGRGLEAVAVHHITQPCLPTAYCVCKLLFGKLYLDKQEPCFLPCCLRRKLFQAQPAVGSFLSFPVAVYSWTVVITSSFASTILSSNTSFVSAYLIQIIAGCGQVPSEDLLP